jgi:hypothetical protein
MVVKIDRRIIETLGLDSTTTPHTDSLLMWKYTETQHALYWSERNVYIYLHINIYLIDSADLGNNNSQPLGLLHQCSMHYCVDHLALLSCYS